MNFVCRSCDASRRRQFIRGVGHHHASQRPATDASPIVRRFQNQATSLEATATSTMTCDQSKLGLPDLRTTNGAPYFILSEGCFAATACCFFWFAAFALICFCAACLCTDFGDLSPIISLPFGFRFAHPQHVRFSERVNETVTCIADF